MILFSAQNSNIQNYLENAMSAKSVSRRDFLKAAGITLGASVVTCSGLGFAATRRPAIETPEINYEKETLMNKRILVAYATRAGSTVKVAAAIGEVIAARSFEVDVKLVKEKPSLEGYQAVLVGSAIRMGNWLPEAIEFVRINQQTLDRLPVALFTVHMLNREDDEESRANRLAYLKDVRPLLNSAEEVFFAGKFDMSRLSFLDRMIPKAVKAVDEDCRDWDRIQGWAQTVFA
jgi:menaquinone-dependent protoporphyrinogen oxidase